MLIFGLLILCVYLASVVSIGYAIFSPFLPDIKRKPTAIFRFQLTDLFGVTILLQIVIAGFMFLFPDVKWDTEIAIVVSVSILLIVGAFAFYGMRLLWRMNIEFWFKRIVLLVVVVPFGSALAIVGLPLLLSVTSYQDAVIKLMIVGIGIGVVRMLVKWVRSNQTVSRVLPNQPS